VGGGEGGGLLLQMVLFGNQNTVDILQGYVLPHEGLSRLSPLPLLSPIPYPYQDLWKHPVGDSQVSPAIITFPQSHKVLKLKTVFRRASRLSRRRWGTRRKPMARLGVPLRPGGPLLGKGAVPEGIRAPCQR